MTLLIKSTHTGNPLLNTANWSSIISSWNEFITDYVNCLYKRTDEIWTYLDNEHLNILQLS